MGGRFGASLATPRTRRSASNTRSACGPHANGPGSCTANKQDSAFVRGSSAHARPADTNVTVCEAVALFGHPAGSDVPSASTAPTGVGVPVGDPSTAGTDGGNAEPPLVHAPTSATTASDQRSTRMGIGDGTPETFTARELGIEPQSEAITSSGMSKLA